MNQKQFRAGRRQAGYVTPVPHTRRRYIDATGRKRGVLALDRRDRSPRYQGPGDPDQCPHCQSGAPHSSALHSQFVEERKEEWEE